MKKNFQIIGVLTLIWFSFFCTEKTANVIKNIDEIMLKIKEEKEKYNIKYVDSIIVKDTIIPGLSGYNVDEEKSYEKMKRLGRYNPTLYVYNKIRPSISIYDNYDKYIIQGNPKKRIVSFVFRGNIDEIKQINSVLNSNSITASYLLKNSSYNELTKYIDDNFDFIIDKEINIKNEDIKVYCYNKDRDSNFLKYCSSNKYFSIFPTLTIENDFYIKIKKNLRPGMIVFLNINDKTIYELPSVLNYLKSKGYDFTNLTNLITE